MNKLTTAAVAGVLIVPGTAVSAAGASTAPTDNPVVANYDGKTIKLADGWQTAHACVVLAGDAVNCFDTEAEMRDSLVEAAKGAAPAGLATAAAACSDPTTLVTLYADTGMAGNSLSFVATNNWVNLAPYGFDNDMESWVNQTACNATVADGTGGTGAQLTLAAHSSSSNVGTTWKNRASSIKVLP